ADFTPPAEVAQESVVAEPPAAIIESMLGEDTELKPHKPDEGSTLIMDAFRDPSDAPNEESSIIEIAQKAAAALDAPELETAAPAESGSEAPPTLFEKLNQQLSKTAQSTT